MRLRPGAGYHELCLAVIETGVVYYLHQDLCVEVGAPEVSGEAEAGHNLTLSPGMDRVTLGWKASNTASTVR